MDRNTAVYVLGSDERVRYGKVVDVAEHGLFIDYCSDRRREYAAFGSMFSYYPIRHDSLDLYHFCSQQQSGGPIKVFVRETPSGPWMWLPGEFVCVGSGGQPAMYGAALVQWQCPHTGARCTDVLPLQRIKRAGDSDERDFLRNPIGPQTFIKRSVDFGEEFRPLSTEDAADLVKRLNHCDDRRLRFVVWPVDVVDLVDDKLQFLYKPDFSEENAVSKGYLSIFHAIQRLRTGLLIVIQSLLEGKSLAIVEDIPLPCELWQEVFSYVGTVKQTQLRAVCALWNQILAAPALNSIFSIQNTDDSRHYRTGFLGMVTVYKLLRPGTQRVVIARSFDATQKSINYVMRLCEMVQYVAGHRTGIRLRCLHLHGLPLTLQIRDFLDNSPDRTECGVHQSPPVKPTLHPEEDYYWLQDFVTGIRNLPCDTIHMNSCRISLVCKFYTGYLERKYRHKTGINIRSLRLKTGVDFGCALWDELKAARPMPSEPQIQKLIRGLRAVVKIPDSDRFRKDICQALCVLHSADPRPASHYHGKRWCVDGLQDLQWEKLSRLTQQFLVELQSSRAFYL